jgi:HEAT repeat protein
MSWPACGNVPGATVVGLVPELVGADGPVMAHDRRDIWIGPVGPIPVSEEKTPRRLAAEAGAVRAQTLTTVDEHLDALRSDPDEWTRCELVARLEARGRDDARTVPALVDALADDSSAFVRDAAAMALCGHVEEDRVGDALAHALADEDAEVRSSAAYGLARRRA